MAKPINPENPFIVILTLGKEDGETFYRAVSVADRSIRSERLLLETVFQFIQYDSTRPLQNKTIYGLLHMASVRACSIPMEERDPGIQFAIRPSGILGRSIVAHDQILILPNATVHKAEHFTLF
jgi:hypothetical protein